MSSAVAPTKESLRDSVKTASSNAPRTTTTATATATADKQSRAARMDISADQDERLLAHFGYEQELRREFTKWSIASYATSILGVLGSVPALLAFPLSAGGPATAVWCWIIGSCLAYCIACSVSELVSAYPTAGGIYFVTKHVVPRRHVAIWAWIIGWCNFLGQTAGVSSVAYTVSQMILACASMNSGLVDGSYLFSPTAAETVLLSILILILMGVLCSLSSRQLSNIIFYFAPINILASIAIIVALLALTPDKRDAQWVFTEITDGSGWDNRGFSFLLGFMAVAWTMTDYDGTTHMSEETRDAAIRGPFAIRVAIAVSGLLGTALTITLCFCLGDYDATMNTATGMPAAQIFLNAGGQVGGTIMWFFVILVQSFTGCSAMLADTRMAYAFARDEALPFSRVWSRINSVTLTPVNAVWLVVAFSIALNLIALGSTQTSTAIFNITAPALDLSYVAVIFAHLFYGHPLQYVDRSVQYTLGRWGKPVNIVAIVWVVFISVVLFFPTQLPITILNMNYAICVAAFIAVFSLSWWWLGARHTYTGPRTKELYVVPTTPPPEDDPFDRTMMIG